MSELVKTALAEKIAKLSRLVPVPVEPFGYGLDSSGVTDLTANLDEVDAFSAHGVAEALTRRLQTPRGTLRDDPDYGIDLRAFLNKGTPLSEVRDLEGQIRGEVRKDDRVADATAVVTLPTLSSMRIVLTVTLADPTNDAPFDLTLAVSSGAVLLEAIRARP